MDALVAWTKGLALGSGGKATLELFRTFYREDFRQEMKVYTMPTLILHGSSDMSAPLDLTGKPTATLIEASKLRVYEDGSHGIFLTHAERVNAEIIAFALET